MNGNADIFLIDRKIFRTVSIKQIQEFHDVELSEIINFNQKRVYTVLTGENPIGADDLTPDLWEMMEKAVILSISKIFPESNPSLVVPLKPISTEASPNKSITVNSNESVEIVNTNSADPLKLTDIDPLENDPAEKGLKRKISDWFDSENIFLNSYNSPHSKITPEANPSPEAPFKSFSIEPSSKKSMSINSNESVEIVDNNSSDPLKLTDIDLLENDYIENDLKRKAGGWFDLENIFQNSDITPDSESDAKTPPESCKWSDGEFLNSEKHLFGEGSSSSNSTDSEMDPEPDTGDTPLIVLRPSTKKSVSKKRKFKYISGHWGGTEFVENLRLEFNRKYHRLGGSQYIGECFDDNPIFKN